jgi:hypothetical protein
LIPLKKFDHNFILLTWAESPSDHKKDLEILAKSLRLRQVDPEDLKIPNLRRFIQKLLKRRGLLPSHRPPTDADYQTAKQKFIAAWYSQDLQ